jgi:hypothetical protein
VSSFEPTATTAASSVVFAWQPIGADTYSPAVDCVGLGGLVGSDNVGGRELRAGFNKDYTKALGTNTANQASAVGWLTPDDQFTQLSPTVSDDFAKQLDTNPMYHAGKDRIYYWDEASQPARLMSLAADGGTPQPEPQMGEGFDADSAVLSDSTTPLLNRRGSGTVYNKAGTLAANVVITDLVVVPMSERDSLGTATSGIPITSDSGEFAGSLTLAGFVADSTVVMYDGMQIYAVTIAGQTAKATRLTTNDKLPIFDVTLSADGTGIAFLANDGGILSLYQVPIAGGTPKKISTFPGAAHILEYTEE